MFHLVERQRPVVSDENYNWYADTLLLKAVLFSTLGCVEITEKGCMSHIFAVYKNNHIE